MGEVFTLPAEWALAMGQRLGDEVDSLPQSVLILHGIAIVGGHLAAARFDETNLEPTAGNDIDHGILLGDPHRVAAQGDERTEAQNARLPRLARDNADKGGVGADQAVD